MSVHLFPSSPDIPFRLTPCDLPIIRDLPLETVQVNAIDWQSHYVIETCTASGLWLDITDSQGRPRKFGTLDDAREWLQAQGWQGFVGDGVPF